MLAITGNSERTTACAPARSPETYLRWKSTTWSGKQLAGPQIQLLAPQIKKSRAWSSEPQDSCSLPL